MPKGVNVMLDRETVATIQTLLSTTNSSQRAIARRLGVSRGAVQSILRRQSRLLSPLTRAANGDTAPHARCPGCGAKVKMPCLACYLRKNK
jgi:IS30 family transposase